MNPYNLATFITAISTLVIGLFVLFRNTRSSLHRIFFLYSTSISLWAFGAGWHQSTDIDFIALISIKISHVFIALIPVCFLHFTVILLHREGQCRNLLRATYAISFLFGVFSLTTALIIAKVGPRLGFPCFLIPGPLYLPLIIFFSICAGLGLLFLLEAAISNQYGASQKKQYSYLFGSSLIGYITGASNFLPVFGFTWFPYPYGSYGITLYVFVVAYITFKFGFFDLSDLAQAAHRDKLTAIGVLAASINHEVKNPLFIIKGLAESCLERQREGVFPTKEKALDGANEAFKRTMEQADRAMDIIKRLSLFAKAGIESEIKLEPVKVSAVLEDILPLLRYELAAHGITLIRDLPPSLPEVQADRRYLEEIFFNLIVNACQALKDANKPGEIIIRAVASNAPRTHPVCTLVDTPGVYKGSVVIEISDNGPGIPGDKLKDVFRPFYTTKAEGTGLGLYITQQLVEKIKGRISVSSEAGKNTTFTVSLPPGPKT